MKGARKWQRVPVTQVKQPSTQHSPLLGIQEGFGKGIVFNLQGGDLKREGIGRLGLTTNACPLFTPFHTSSSAPLFLPTHVHTHMHTCSALGCTGMKRGSSMEVSLG